MTGHEGQPEEAAEAEAQEHELPFWLQATPDDIAGLEFEAPIIGCNSADCVELSTLYRKEATELQEAQGNQAAAKVFAMLSAGTDLHFKPNDRNAPFGAMMIMGDRRSAIPEDFRGIPVSVLAYAAENAANQVLRARLCDLCWLLERKRHQLGRAAIASYVAIAEGLGSGSLKDRLDRDDPLLGLTARDVLRRALSMGRPLGWDIDEVIAARTLLSAIRARAVRSSNPVPVHWFFEMDLDFGISDPSIIAAEIEAYLTGGVPEPGSHMIVELWRLAARGHHYAKDEDGKNRCRTGAAEALVAESEKHTSAMLASHWLSEAIAEYHGVPGQRKRRTQLRHKLIDVQSGIADEMSSFSHPMDLSAIADQVKEQLEGERDLIDLLLIFADLEQSPSPKKLMEDAVKSINNHPLSSLFGASFHDHEGKVIHKSEGGGFGDGDNGDAIRLQISQHESMRRGIHVSGQVQVARQYITRNYYVGEDTLQALIRHSPFVPNDLVNTFSRGFARFFEGDCVSALYILTPMLENSLRHILKLNGYDVTTFDDAKQVQEDRTISALFEQMRPELEEAFGDAITTDIDNVFLSKPGPSLRHAVAHGLLNDSSPYGTDAIYACWLIFRLCCIPLFEQRERLRLPS
ncbi:MULTISPECIES: DUF4209 domain-containing protein [unclassified Brucella]|uniref:DUF4209 domain-containing protein n=1 Tax=Brucella amazoniensis TaxID=2837955 RepID=UPI00384F916A